MSEPEQVPVSQLVVVGSSAGGIDALSTLVSTLPADFPAPLVIAQHLDPARPSYLAEILTRRSALPVRPVTDHIPLEPGVVFVVPANRHVEITDHAISLRVGSGGSPRPSVDLLLSSAAAVFGESLIAVILTGTGRDGASGARAVKQAGGTVVIQNPQTAQFAGMPAAISPPLVDMVADLETIGPLLTDLLNGAYLPARPAENRTLQELLTQLHDASGIDFSSYKMPTILRRLQRRMAANGIQRLSDYTSYLQNHPEEYERLIGSFLIKVTEFFRDPDLFSYLREQILPAIVTAARTRDMEIRLWSAGCATGEEAYSLAILLAEALGEDLDLFTVRVFATDLDATAISFARRGIYPAAALSTLAPELVARYFTEIEGQYEVNKRVRTLTVFGQHDLGQRAPFPRIDLCLCRNVLIYFTPDLQQRALQLFAFSLRDDGYLVLGKAETTSPLAEYFTPVQPHLKVYQRQGDRLMIPAARIRDTSPLRLSHGTVGARLISQPEPPRLPRETQRTRTAAETEAVLLRALPVGVILVDRHYDIQSINSTARRLLGIHSAALGEDLVHLVENLPVPGLRAAIDAAFGHAPASQSMLAPFEATDGVRRYLRISCAARPRPGAAADDEGSAGSGESVLVLVSDVTAEEQVRREQDETIARLRERIDGVEARMQRVAATNSALESANEQLSAANAELRSANEEFLVGTEETQAALEEVETLNEELQATNEELETLNEELQATVEELNTTNDDLEARGLELQEQVVAREEQRRASEAERARLAAILLGMAEAMLVVNRAGEVVLENAAVERLFGPAGADFAPHDENGQPLPPDQTPRARAARGESFVMAFTLPEPGGGRRWFEATGQSIGGEGMEPGSVVVIRDITERGLRRLQEQFLALASHELRTPLTPLRGYLQMLSRLFHAEEQDGRVRRYLTQAQEQLQRLQRLVDDLLDVSRLSEGKLSLRFVPVDLAPLVRDLVEAVQATGGIQMQVQAGEGALMVRGDTTRLEQILLNLLNNAAKYAPNGGRIDVRLHAEDGMAVLEVGDYGPGIALAALPHIFERFYRADGSSGQQGLGVGLFITRELVQAHGGEIAVDSTPGEGATFTVRLPLLDGGDGAASEPQAE